MDHGSYAQNEDSRGIEPVPPVFHHVCFVVAVKVNKIRLNQESKS